jgi:hypothetical protein
MTRAAAEQVIGGVGVRSAAATALTGLLRSLAPAPGLDRELSGEADALAALRAARRARSSGAAATAGRPQRRRALSAVLTVKAAVLTAVALVGGVAVAAGVGVLPTPMNVISPNPRHSASAPAISNGDASASATASTARSPAGSPGLVPIPSPGVANPVNLCHNYLKLAATDRGKALASSAYQTLVAAASGIDMVPAYCAALISESPNTAGPAHKPTHPAHPSHTPTPKANSTPDPHSGH